MRFDSSPDIPARWPLPRHGPGRRHLPAPAAHWGLSDSQRIRKTPAGIFSGVLYSGVRMLMDGSPPGGAGALRPLGLQHLFVGGSRARLPKNRRRTKPAPRTSIVPRPSSRVSARHSPPGPSHVSFSGPWSDFTPLHGLVCCADRSCIPVHLQVSMAQPGHLKMDGDTATVCAAYKAVQRGEV